MDRTLIRWLPWLGVLLAIDSIFLLYDQYSQHPSFDPIHGSPALRFGPRALMLVLGIVTIRESLRRFDQPSALRIVWASIVVQVGANLLHVVWSRSPSTLVLSLAGVATSLTVVTAASFLLGAVLGLKDPSANLLLLRRTVAKVLATALCVRFVLEGVDVVRSAMEHGLAGWNSGITIIDSFLIIAWTGALLWACAVELRPDSGLSTRSRRLFQAMTVWLLATTLHEMYGLYLSVFIFDRPFVQGLAMNAPWLVWIVILTLSIAAVFRTEAIRCNSEPPKHP